MSSQPPNIDQRTYNDLVQQAVKLVSATDIQVGGKTTKWLPPSETGKLPDPGYALIRIFSRMTALVRDRLNKVPEKNFLAFLDLLGGQLQPPQPARVPLTFHLAEGSTSEGVVPTNTQIAATPDQDNPEEVVFETEQQLVVTTAKLEAVYVRQPDQDEYQDCTDVATGKVDQAFSIFQGDKKIEHYLYVACEEIFSLSKLEKVTLTFKMATNSGTNSYDNLLISWSYWAETTWKELYPKPPNMINGAITFDKLPLLTPYEINGIKGRWLRAGLSNVLTSPPPIEGIEGSVTVDTTGLSPDLCLFNSTPLDLSKDFYPFGERPGFNDTFYIASQAAFSRPGARVTVTVNLNQTKQVSNGGQLVWEAWNGQRWDTLPEAITFKFLSNQSNQPFTFSVPDWLKPNDAVNGELHYWIRARITSGLFGTPGGMEGQVFFDGATKVSTVSTDDSKTSISIDSETGFLNGDIVWIIKQGSKPKIPLQARPENFNVAVVESVNQKTLKLAAKYNFDQSDLWIIRNPYVVTVQIPETYTPPVVESIGLGINITLTAPALCQANNDFSYTTFITTTLREAVEESGKDLKLASVAGLAVGDRLTITDADSNNPEDQQIEKIDEENNWITLVKGVQNKRSIGARVKRCATTFLREAVNQEANQIRLETIAGLVDGDELSIVDADGNDVELVTIKSSSTTQAAINASQYQVLLTQKLQKLYSQGAKLIYPFRPFVAPVDETPTLYLGFSQPESLDQQNSPPFNNKTVTLYAEVQPPSPDDLSAEPINSGTTLSETATKDKTQIVVENATGWRIGDRIQLELTDKIDPTNPKKIYDNYFIKEIKENKKENKFTVTLTTGLKQDYTQNDKVIRPMPPIQVEWEYSSPMGWNKLSGVQDETQAFFQRGLIQFIGPADFKKVAQFGQNLYWLRVRWVDGNFWVKPRLRRLLLNTTWAVQAMTLNQEVLGSSNGDRNQVFSTSQKPVLEGQQLEVREDSAPTDETGNVEAVWVTWQEVPDFYRSQAKDRHYILDRQTGTVQFGDGVSGMIPPRDLHNTPNNIRMSYKTGGGIGGNKAAQTITQLKTTIPYVDRVTNLEAAGGGAEQEDLEHLKERVPKRLRHRDRAVTQQDFEDLAYAASTAVARVKVVSADEITPDAPDATIQSFDPLRSANWLNPDTEKLSYQNPEDRSQHDSMTPGKVKVIIIPHSPDRLPIPSLSLLKQVETHLRNWSQPGVDLIVTGPRWAEVSVTTEIVPHSVEQADAVRTAVMQRLESFLHPLSGGQGGRGWFFGRYPHRSDLYAVIQAVPGVDHVHFLQIEPEFDDSDLEQLAPNGSQSSRTGSQQQFSKATLLGVDCFIYSGSHKVTVTFHGGGDKR